MGGRGLISFCFRSLCAATRPSQRQAVPGAPWPGSTPGSKDAVRTEPPARMGHRREPGLGRTPRRPSGSGVHRGSRGQSRCGRGRLATQPQRPRDANPSGDAASHSSAEPRRQGPRRCRRRAGRQGGASARRADLVGSIGGRKLEQRDYSYNLPLSGP